MNDKTDLLLDTAFSYYNAGDFKSAEALARQALIQNENHGDALYLLGLIAYQNNAFDPAIDLFYKAVKLYPDVKNYQLVLASVLQKQGRLDEALSFYEKFPEDAVALAQIGLIYAQKNNIDFARSHFEKSLEIEKNTPAYIGLALIERQAGTFEKALALLQTAAALTSDGETLYQLAVQYRLMGDFAVALGTIEAALSKIKLAPYLNEKGLILEKLNDPSKALESYIAAAHLDPYQMDAYVNQGNIHAGWGEFAAAEDAYKRALAIDPEDTGALYNLAHLLYKQDRTYESLEYLRKAVAGQEGFVPALYLLAVILEGRAEYSEAAGLYFYLLSLSAPLADLDFRIADTLAHLAVENKKQAQDFAKGWVKNFPDNPIALHTLAAVNGKKSEAAEEYAQKLYDLFAETYDQTMAKIETKVLDEIGDLIKGETFKNVLDLGCGTGEFGRRYGGQCRQLTGVDISVGMIGRLKNKTAAYHKTVVAPVTDFLEKNTQQFDLVVAVELFCHLSTIDGLFEKIAGALMKNGAFIFSIEKSLDKNILAASGRYLYTEGYIEGLLQKNGFKIERSLDIDLRRENTGYAKGRIVKAVKV